MEEASLTSNCAETLTYFLLEQQVRQQSVPWCRQVRSKYRKTKLIEMRNDTKQKQETEHSINSLCMKIQVE